MNEFDKALDKLFAEIMSDWPSREEMQRKGTESRLMADDGVMPQAGKSYTVSPDFNRGDRSWIDCVWKVVAVSGPNVIVDIESAGVKQRVFRIDERAWYLVENV